MNPIKAAQKELIEAVENGNLEECKRLLAADENLSLQRNLAMRCAAKHGHLEVCKLLIEHGRIFKVIMTTHSGMRHKMAILKCASGY